MTFEQHIEKILEMFPNIPNPEHEPKRFMYYLKLYRYHYTQTHKKEK